MITVKQFRDKDGMRFEQATLEFQDPLEAMAHLTAGELSWGGHIIEASDERIEVRTQVFHCLDTSIFEGPAKELRPLLELVYFYVEANKEHGDLIVDGMVRDMEHLPKNMSGVPLILAMITPLLAGCNRLKVAVMLACGINDPDEIKTGLEARVVDLVAAVQLSQSGECSFREALSL